MSPRTVLRHGPLDLRFWWLVEMGPEKECWPWLGATDRKDYGRFMHQGAQHLAHRLALELSMGVPLPSDIVAMHLCDNPPCCNPAHLWPGTATENTRDAVAKRRHSFGERSSQALLTDDKAREIIRRRWAGEPARALAREFGVSDSLVCAVAAGRKWAHVQAVSP